MDVNLFSQTMTFIVSDIQREIALARISLEGRGHLLPDELRTVPGGGNFLAALGLLCYTEFAGGLQSADFSPGRGRKNFNMFFDGLAPEYRTFNTEHDVYGDLRCGLTHEYYIKQQCAILMLDDGHGIGVRWENNGYVFVVERYFKDFKRAFLRLRDLLFRR